MRTNEVLRDHADSESVCECGVDRNSAEFVGNKQIHSLTHSLTHRHSTLYISWDGPEAQLLQPHNASTNTAWFVLYLLRRDVVAIGVLYNCYQLVSPYKGVFFYCTLSKTYYCKYTGEDQKIYWNYKYWYVTNMSKLPNSTTVKRWKFARFGQADMLTGKLLLECLEYLEQNTNIETVSCWKSINCKLSDHCWRSSRPFWSCKAGKKV